MTFSNLQAVKPSKYAIKFEFSGMNLFEAW